MISPPRRIQLFKFADEVLRSQWFSCANVATLHKIRYFYRLPFTMYVLIATTLMHLNGCICRFHGPGQT